MDNLDANCFKDVHNKPRLGFVYRSLLNHIIAVREFGAKKYIDHNTWEKVDIDDYYHAAFRHISAMCDARFNPKSKYTLDDAESGLRHAAHVACNIMYILEAEEREGTKNVEEGKC
jgi:hypothetical protein